MTIDTLILIVLTLLLAAVILCVTLGRPIRITVEHIHEVRRTYTKPEDGVKEDCEDQGKQPDQDKALQDAILEVNEIMRS